MEISINAVMSNIVNLIQNHLTYCLICTIYLYHYLSQGLNSFSRVHSLNLLILPSFLSIYQIFVPELAGFFQFLTKALVVLFFYQIFCVFKQLTVQEFEEHLKIHILWLYYSYLFFLWFLLEQLTILPSYSFKIASKISQVVYYFSFFSPYPSYLFHQLPCYQTFYR